VNISDSQARKEAIDPTKSFIVSAPAGSGKTGLITQRILRLLSVVNNPEEILAITFTKKAASEMISRVHEALMFAQNSDRPSEPYLQETYDLASEALARDSRLRWNLIDNPNRLRIQTIDSFCRYVSQQFAIESTMGDLNEPADHPEIAYAQAARSLLEKLENEDDQALEIIVAQCGNDLNRVEAMLAELLTSRDEWLPVIYSVKDSEHYFHDVLNQLVNDKTTLLAEILAPIAGELVALADFAGSNIDNPDSPIASLKGITELPANELDGIALWKALANLLMTGDGEIRKTITKREGFNTNAKEEKQRMLELLEYCRQNQRLMHAINHVVVLPDCGIGKTQQRVLGALSEILPRLAAELITVFRQTDNCDYQAITIAALAALQGDTSVSDITLRLDYQIQHILVDEFQDTSTSQMSLLEGLVSGWQQDDGRTLFLVGDAMQSLYGFRNANVGLFIKCQELPVGGVDLTPINLTSNFRSEKGIVDFVNKAFVGAFPDAPDANAGAIPYSASEAVKPKGQPNPVYFHGFDDAKTYDQDEAEAVAAQCEELINQNTGETTAILVKNRNHLKAIIPALIERKVRYEAHDIAHLNESMPVSDLIVLTRALLNPTDRIAWLALLRAPFIGLSLGDVLTITNATCNNRYTGDAVLMQLLSLSDKTKLELSEYGQKSIERVMPIIASAFNNIRRNGLRFIIEKTWESLGGHYTLNSSAQLSDARRYLDLLEAHERAGMIDNFDAFEIAASKLFAAPDAQNSQCVQIMTIHKAKGLEFDHVILPGLDRPSKSDQNPLLRFERLALDGEIEDHILMAPLGAHDEENEPLYQYLKANKATKSTYETTRLLYVACTRAIKSIHMFSKLKAKKTSFDLPGKRSLLKPIWPTIKDGLDAELTNYQVGGAAEIIDDPTPKTTLMKRLNVSADLLSRDSDHCQLLLCEKKAQKKAAFKDPDAKLSKKRRSMGILLHRALRQVAVEGVDEFNQQRLDKMEKSWPAQLQEMGVGASDKDISEIRSAIRTTTEHAKGRWILKHHADTDISEKAFGYRNLSDKENAGSSIIDRSFVDESGVRWIIDYKLSNPRKDEDIDEFEARQIHMYEEKMRHYRDIYRAIEPQRTIKMALYFPSQALFMRINS